MDKSPSPKHVSLLSELVFGLLTLYANAFSADLGRCFRWVRGENTGRPMHCPGLVAIRGWWKDSAGLW